MEKETSSRQSYKYSLKDLATFISIAFAILCFIIFIYWKGYADNLGINTNLMNISYKENVYMIILTFISSVIIFYPSFLISKQFSNKVDKMEILIACIIFILNFLCSIYLFSPNLNLKKLLSLFVIYFILIIIVAVLISTKPALNNCPSILLKLSIILFLIFGLSSIYDLGKDSIKNQFTYSVTKNNEYAVVYTTQDKYILNSVKIKDDKLIFTNKTQIIVDCNNVEITKQKFHNVEVRNP